MDKLREDFKKDFEFLDWLKALSKEEREQYLSQPDIIDEGNDPTMLNLDEKELEEWIMKYNLHDAKEWVERFNGL